MVDMLDGEAAQDDLGETEENNPSLIKSFGVDLEFLCGDNMSFYQGNKAYYEDRNYAEAIEAFKAAIEYERSRPPNSLDSIDSINRARTKEPSEVIAKSMYWIGESYIKLNQIDQALKMFEQLSRGFSQHYLGLAAQRRSATLLANQKCERAKKDLEEKQKALELRKQKRRESEKQRKLELANQKRERAKKDLEEKQRKLELRKQKEEEKRIRRRPLEPFIQAAKQVLGAEIKATIDSPNLNPRDIQLVTLEEWYKGPKGWVIRQQLSENGFNKEILIEIAKEIANDDNELERILSS